MEWLKFRNNKLISFYIITWIALSIFYIIDYKIISIKGSVIYINNLVTLQIYIIAGFNNFNAYLSAIFIFLILLESFNTDKLIFNGEYKLFFSVKKSLIIRKKFFLYITFFASVNLFYFLILYLKLEIFNFLIFKIFLLYFLKYFFNSTLYIVQIIIVFKLFKFKYYVPVVIFLFTFLLSLALIKGFDFIPLNHYINSLSFQSKILKDSIFDIKKFITPDLYNLGYTIFLISLYYLKNAFKKREKFEYQR